MPGQNIEKQTSQVLKVLNMTPTIPSNNSSQQLVFSGEEVGEETAEIAPGPPPTKVSIREWIAVSILCFVNLINYMDRYTLAGILTEVQSFYSIDDTKGGLIQTSFVLSYMLFAPLFGYLGDRYSRKYIMAFGVFLWSITTLIGSFMDNFWWFVAFRALVGIGEASYSTIAPTIISDLFVKETRSKMLTLFYFAIPVGSGLGYIVGSQIASAAGQWQWALRATPVLGIIAVVLVLFILQDPERGASECSGHLVASSWSEDIKHLVKNGSFMLSTAGFTCVSFVAGALAWWGPKIIHMGIMLQPGGGDIKYDDVAYKFGVISMISGLVGVPTGSWLSRHFRGRYPRVDAHICAAALLLSTPMVFMAMIMAPRSATWCYLFVFFGEFFLNLTWSIVADILLYVVMPTRRSSAEGFQLLIAHALGDAGSPSLIGVLSETFKGALTPSTRITSHINTSNVTAVSEALISRAATATDEVSFRALQYALFTTCFVEVLGGIFFLANALFIVKDRQRVDLAVKGAAAQEPTNLNAAEVAERQNFLPSS